MFLEFYTPLGLGYIFLEKFYLSHIPGKRRLGVFDSSVGKTIQWEGEYSFTVFTDLYGGRLRRGIITVITRIVRTFYSRFGGFVRKLLRRSFRNAAAGYAPPGKVIIRPDRARRRTETAPRTSHSATAV